MWPWLTRDGVYGSGSATFAESARGVGGGQSALTGMQGQRPLPKSRGRASGSLGKFSRQGVR